MKPNPYILKEAKALIERRAPVAELRAWADKHKMTPAQAVRLAAGKSAEGSRPLPPQPRGEAAATILFAQQHGRLPDDLPVPA